MELEFDKSFLKSLEKIRDRKILQKIEQILLSCESAKEYLLLVKRNNQDKMYETSTERLGLLVKKLEMIEDLKKNNVTSFGKLGNSEELAEKFSDLSNLIGN